MALRSGSLLKFRVGIKKPAEGGRGTVDAPSRAATVRERAWTREAARSHEEPAGGGRAACIFAGVALLLFMPVHLACTGRASLVVTSLDYKSIDPPPAYSKIDLDECYWWTDEHEQVWIAMRRRIRSPISSDFDFDFSLSLLLDRLPAGSARNYLVGKEELRGVAEVGPLASTFESSAGILALYRESGDRLRGSLKLEVLRRTASLLGGRTRATRYLFAGGLLAIHDERRGREIAMKIEGPAEPTPDEDATDRSPGWDAHSDAPARGTLDDHRHDEGPGDDPVRTEPVRTETVQEHRRVTGSLQAVARSSVASQEAGQVLAVLIDEGMTVQRGQVALPKTPSALSTS